MTLYINRWEFTQILAKALQSYGVKLFIYLSSKFAWNLTTVPQSRVIGLPLLCVCVCVCVCIYIYIYTYILQHTHTRPRCMTGEVNNGAIIHPIFFGRCHNCFNAGFHFIRKPRSIVTMQSRSAFKPGLWRHSQTKLFRHHGYALTMENVVWLSNNPSPVLTTATSVWLKTVSHTKIQIESWIILIIKPTRCTNFSNLFLE